MNNRSDLKPSPSEKKQLRANGVRLADIHKLGVKVIQEMLNVSRIRAMELCASAEFQSLPSVGPRFAADLISMGYYSLHDLRKKDGARLTDQYEKQVGVWVDPCVEDQFRLVVHYAKHPGIHKNWWDFTTERKAYRAENGYPVDRPGKAWHELPQYRPVGKKKDTIDSAATKVKAAARYIRAHLTETVTLQQLAREVGLSPFHLLRQFKQVYKKAPGQFLVHQRLKKASRLLKKTMRPVHVVSQQCGFSNESSFIRAFKRALRTTPLQYRSNRKG